MYFVFIFLFLSSVCVSAEVVVLSIRFTLIQLYIIMAAYSVQGHIPAPDYLSMPVKRKETAASLSLQHHFLTEIHHGAVAALPEVREKRTHSHDRQDLT